MADQLVETAVANWAPRFCANGVDTSDYARITASIERWDDWCAAWCAAGDAHLALAEAAREGGHRRTAGEAFARASTYYHFGKFLFVHDRDQERRAHQRAVDALNAALPLLSPPGRRELVPFEGSSLAAVLRTPPGPGPHPTVILIPGLDSTKEEFREVERTFLDRDMATFAIDGPGQGESEWTLPIRADWEVVGAAVLAHLATIPEIDRDRVGVWGVSLGGYYATRLAASDLPIRATIALSGPYDFGHSWENLNALTRRAFEVRSGSRTPDAAARRASELTMAGRTAAIRTPLLVVMGKQDRLFSWRDGERLVNEVGENATLVALDEGNHGCANVVSWHRPQSADWMAQRLGVLATDGEA